jgi:hypothetical protein
MKIKFNLFQLLILLITLLIIYKYGPLYYDSWVNPIYEKYKGSMYLNENQLAIRFIGSTIIIVSIIRYLIITDFKILFKKREINLTPWKSTN